MVRSAVLSTLILPTSVRRLESILSNYKRDGPAWRVCNKSVKGVPENHLVNDVTDLYL